MNARFLIYPSLLLSITTAMGAFTQKADLTLIASVCVFLSLVILWVALRRKEETPQIPPEFQAKLGSLEHLNQRQQSQLSEAQLKIDILSKELTATKSQIERLTAQTASYEAALQKEKAHNTGHQTQGQAEQAVIQFVRNMQSRGRILDFLMTDIHKLSDPQVGAASRVVHQGLRGMMDDYFSVKPISSSDEGLMIPLHEGDLGRTVKLLQSRGETLPREGRLLHKGWQASQVKLPQSQRQEMGEERMILALAEVDVSECESESESEGGMH